MNFDEAMREREKQQQRSDADAAYRESARQDALLRAASEIGQSLRGAAGYLERNGAPRYRFTFKSGLVSRSESPVGFVLTYTLGDPDQRKPQKPRHVTAVQMLCLDGLLWNWHWGMRQGEFTDVSAESLDRASGIRIAGNSVALNWRGELVVNRGFGDGEAAFRPLDFATGFASTYAAQPIEAPGLTIVSG